METKHTKEPWYMLGENGTMIYAEVDDAKGWAIANLCTYHGHAQDSVNAARIVSCVNACAGISDPSAIADCIAALERIIRGHDMSGYTCPTLHGEDAEAPTLLDEARAALAKLRGEQ